MAATTRIVEREMIDLENRIVLVLVRRERQLGRGAL